MSAVVEFIRAYPTPFVVAICLLVPAFVLACSLNETSQS